ncbi:hypothetical protein EXN66_Car001120 [Channa argus]|uniref:Uncharacterized protein n=1 Tax=Channa argus TaxID=215402 RepID=A0A6G1QZR3_CHAAH|nr:hypothetical protein EXN66_Car001120 [Channa argus]
MWCPSAHIHPEPSAGEGGCGMENIMSGARTESGRPSDYRPVVLNSYLVKVLERLVLDFIQPLVKPYLDPLQFDYLSHPPHGERRWK